MEPNPLERHLRWIDPIVTLFNRLASVFRPGVNREYHDHDQEHT